MCESQTTPSTTLPFMHVLECITVFIFLKMMFCDSFCTNGVISSSCHLCLSFLLCKGYNLVVELWTWDFTILANAKVFHYSASCAAEQLSNVLFGTNPLCLRQVSTSHTTVP